MINSRIKEKFTAQFIAQGKTGVRTIKWNVATAVGIRQDCRRIGYIFVHATHVKT